MLMQRRSAAALGVQPTTIRILIVLSTEENFTLQAAFAQQITAMVLANMKQAGFAFPAMGASTSAQVPPFPNVQQPPPILHAADGGPAYQRESQSAPPQPVPSNFSRECASAPMVSGSDELVSGRKRRSRFDQPAGDGSDGSAASKMMKSVPTPEGVHLFLK